MQEQPRKPCFLCCPMSFPPQGEVGTKANFAYTCPQCGKINQVKEVVCPKCLNGDKDKISSEEKKRFSTENGNVSGKKNSDGKKDHKDCRECCEHCCCNIKCPCQSQQQAPAQQPLAQYGLPQQPFVQQPVQQPFVQQPVQQPFVQQPVQQPIQQPVAQMPIQQPVSKDTDHQCSESPSPTHDPWSSACSCEKGRYLGMSAPLPRFLKWLLIIGAVVVFFICVWSFATSKQKGGCSHK